MPWGWVLVAGLGWGVALVVTVVWLGLRRRASHRARQLAVTLQREVEPCLLRISAERGVTQMPSSKERLDPDYIGSHLATLASRLVAADRKEMGHADTENMATSDTVPLDVGMLADEEMR